MKSFLFYSASICIFQVAAVLFCGAKAKENPKWFSRRWRGGCFSFGQMALRSARARGRAGFFFKLVLAPVARGSFFFRSNGFALRAGQRQGGVFRIPPPYLWTPLSPQRVKGCSPLTSPKKKSKPKNASRFAKRIFLCFSHLRLRRRFHVSAGRYRQQRGNTSCEAANRRNEKKALSAATSFFPFRLPLRGLKGASSPFLVDPARRNRWCFSGSLLARKRELSPNAKVL